MLESVNKKWEFTELSPEEKERRGILGRLYGPCADLIHDTRNGRTYSEQLWEKTFNNDIVKEMLGNGGIPGELDHPTDRSETCSEKIAIMMPEPPKKGRDGKLYAMFDILDTPCGRIAYALAKYGFNLGISSRGNGDIIEDFNGKSSVDPDTYEFQCFDLVTLPAVKAARLKMVESLSPDSQQAFRQALTESLNKSTESDRKIMLETLEHLNIDVNKAEEQAAKNKNVDSKANMAANDDGAEMMKNLQEALKTNESLTKQVRILQEKLSVCYAKEARVEEELNKQKESVFNLRESLKSSRALKVRVTNLMEAMQSQDDLIQRQRNRIQELEDKCSRFSTVKKNLNESLITRNKEAEKLQSQLNESLDAHEEDKKDFELKEKEYTKRLQKSNELVEHYKKVAKTAIEKYMSSKATMIGCTVSDIKQRLSESYSFTDIDRVCEGLRDYQLTTSKLPFNINKKVRAQVKESIEPIQRKDIDNTVDDSLYKIAGLK